MPRWIISESKGAGLVYIIYSLIALAITAADFFVKQYILHNAAVGETFGHFTPLFDFTYVQNTGAAFSILSGKMWLLSLISAAFCIAVVVYVIKKRPTNRLLCLSLALVFAGALGNAIDRVCYGFVVDFIQTTFINFAVFNIADMAITIGAVLLIVYVLLFDRDGKEHE
ncbi:MAG: signal peptidase II [Clostridiales bacterium]|nr:signal peptidase II [Clostridiales bacterium]